MRRVYMRRRIVVGLAVVLVGIVTWLAVAGAASLLRETPSGETAPLALPAAADAPNASYVVQPGDTLWGIARQLDPEGDIRVLVDELAARAGGAGLHAGQRLDLRGLDG
jgi:hypothetical protein